MHRGLPKKNFWIVNATLLAFAAFQNVQPIMKLVGISIGAETHESRHGADVATNPSKKFSPSPYLRVNPPFPLDPS